LLAALLSPGQQRQQQHQQHQQRSPGAHGTLPEFFLNLRILTNQRAAKTNPPESNFPPLKLTPKT